MKVESYVYIVDYDDDIAKVVRELQLNVFETGAYRLDDEDDKAVLNTIDEARDSGGEKGTVSILDVYAIKDELHFACLAPLNDVESLAYFGTDRLTVNDVESIKKNVEFWDSMGRGEARYIVLFDTAGNQGKPVKYLLAGLAFG